MTDDPLVQFIRALPEGCPGPELEVDPYDGIVLVWEGCPAGSRVVARRFMREEICMQEFIYSSRQRGVMFKIDRRPIPKKALALIMEFKEEEG